MFAGAAREAVFSNPDVIGRVNADFVPVALKAALVNNPPADEEGLLYREIGRSKPAPQGICVVNSAGKVLNWALMFDDDASLLAFFDRAKERYARFPDAKRPVPAEVHGRFPSQKRPDVEDSGKVLPVLDRHPSGKFCPAEPPLFKGTVVARLFGRALDKDGKPVADTLRQENYIEDRFNIAVPTQEKLATALAGAGEDRVALPRELTRLWVKQAYMGVLDVQPLDNPNPGPSRGELKECDFGATKVRSGKGPTLWRVDGQSEVFIDERMANGGPGDMHEVKLMWHGFLEMTENRMTGLVLSARGFEKLKFGTARGQVRNELAYLNTGHMINMAGDVRFGIVGEPAGPDKVADASAPVLAAPQSGVPQVARRQIVETLGPPFLVFRDKVQDELRLSEDQARKLEQRLQDTAQETIQVFQKVGEKRPEERGSEVDSYRQQAREKLAAFLKETLKDDQLQRLRQLEFQQEGLFALGQPEVMKELEITAEQRQQFVRVIQELHMKVEPLIQEVQKGGNPQQIQPRVLKLRREYVDRIEAILNDAQKKQWTEMLGQPLELDD